MAKKKITPSDKLLPVPEAPPAAPSPEKGTGLSHITPVTGLYENWFLDYASYVILERAVPYVDDGLKPVQRRILHAMKELEDGRFNKVANIIGQTMKYHPHGDASIGEAIVQIGQKNLLIETQGNWGNIYTGDTAAAPRYIEARISKFALDVVFNDKTTSWKKSYDGRNDEPLTLPVKFPLLLAQGVEGIAVGLACKIMPHNFCELIEASIAMLRKKPVNLMPDFPTGGIGDFSQYNEGLRGGRIRVRACIEKRDRKTLVITEVPFGTTTTTLIDSIITANEKGKIKVKKIEDNTSDKVEIFLHLHSDSYEDIDKTINALYAFTDCEVGISPNSCIIRDDKPHFVSVNEILKICTQNTVQLLKRELEIRLAELQEAWHFSSLEKIFIEKRIYRDIEECETWESIIETIDKGLKPYKKRFRREITVEDITKLTEIKIKRISRFDAKKADEYIRSLEDEMAKVNHNLEHLTAYAVDYYKGLLKKYGKGRERKTKISGFGTINAREVVIANEKLYVNRDEGFAGFSMKKDEFVCECSDIDDIIVFREDGSFIVTKVADKKYVGKNVLHIAIFKKEEEKQIYNLVYRDGLKGNVMVKRFEVGGITRDKEYSLTRGSAGSKVLYFSIQEGSMGESVTIHLKPKPKLRKTTFDFNFNELAVKGRSSVGNILSRNPVQKITRIPASKAPKGVIQPVAPPVDKAVPDAPPPVPGSPGKDRKPASPPVSKAATPQPAKKSRRGKSKKSPPDQMKLF